MPGRCKEASREEKGRMVVAACVNLEQPWHLRAKGRTGITSVLGA